MTTLVDFAAMRPEYSRLERFHDLAILYMELEQPERALRPLEKYLRWNPDDLGAREVHEQIVWQVKKLSQNADDSI